MPNFLKRLLLRHVLKKPSPDVVPRSGEAARQVDCRVAYIRRTEPEPEVLVQSAGASEVTGLRREAGRFQVPLSLSYEDFSAGDVEIIHWYGLTSFRYDGLWRYVLEGLTGFDRASFLYDRARQLGFNRKPLLRYSLTELLDTLVEAAQLHPTEEHSSVSLLVRRYGERCIEHPDWETVRGSTQLFLDALVSSDSLERTATGYRVKPKAVLALAEFQEAERRHRENFRTARAMTRLTVVLVIIGIVQAYVTWMSP